TPRAAGRNPSQSFRPTRRKLRRSDDRLLNGTVSFGFMIYARSETRTVLVGEMVSWHWRRCQRRVPFWMADEKIKQRAEPVDKHDDQHPRDFFAFAQAFVLDG